MKPYHQVKIEECGEPLVAIPSEKFALESPHPYEKLGASYFKLSPYYLRETVLNNLIEAQNQLQQFYPGWRLKIFDAYRPVEVQQFMVNYTFSLVIESERLSKEKLSPQQQQAIWDKVYQIWAVPSFDLTQPPPHSTGAAIDITLVNEKGETIDMGGEIDELSERSHPDYYANATDKQQQQYHQWRCLLHEVMKSASFRRHPGEWWHFCFGDQMWAWLENIENRAKLVTARYGRVLEPL